VGLLRWKKTSVNKIESVRVGFVHVTLVLCRSVTRIKRLDSANSQAQTEISLGKFSSLKLEWTSRTRVLQYHGNKAVCQQQSELLGAVRVFLRSYSSFFKAPSQNCEKWLIASSCLPVHMFALNNLAPTGRVFIKFDVLSIENLPRKFKFL
jgi:hypothetical protein